MLATLREDALRNPWVNKLIQKIEEAPVDVQNQLVMAYSSHQANFKTHLWHMEPMTEWDSGRKKTVTDSEGNEYFVLLGDAAYPQQGYLILYKR